MSSSLRTITIMLWRNLGRLPIMLGGGGLGILLKEGPLGRLRDMER